jgi:uncharacterized repeat protein (TIGR01451 family)
MKQFRNLASLAGVFLCATVATGQVMYTVTPLKFPNAKYSVATAINNQGQVVGWSSMNASDSSEHAFLYSNGVMNDLGTFGGLFSTAKGLNNNGEVVGVAYYPAQSVIGNVIVYNLTHAFYYHGGAIIDLTPNSDYHSEANSINDSGQIAGGYQDPNGTGFFHPFLYQSGTLTDLDPTDGTARSSSAGFINASGQIAGRMLNYPAYNQWYGFYWSNNVLKTFLPAPSGDYNQINGMNDAGQVVGAGINLAGTSTTYPFLYDGNSVRNLFSTCGAANAINNAGHVVGWFGSDDCWTTETGFLFNGSTYSYLYPLGTSSGTSWIQPNAVNRFDQVGGKTFNVNGAYRAFVAYNGVVTDLNTLVDPSLRLVLYNVDHINDSGLLTVADYYNVEYLLTPVLSVASSHTGSFTPGQHGATYSVTVTNAATAPATNGTITVTETLPSGLTLLSMAGNGWTCPQGANTCTRSNSLGPGLSYEPITVTVNVAAGAASPQVNWVSVSEGNVWLANSSDPTSLQVSTTSTTTAFNAGLTYSPLVQNVTLTATVTSASVSVNGGAVTFNVAGVGTVMSGTVTNGNASAVLVVPGSTGVRSYSITATYGGTAGITGSSDSTKALLIAPAQPVINWHNPPDIQFGSALGSGQLNALASFAGLTVPGTYVYDPPAGTVVKQGSITLRAQFTPLDNVNYFTANGSVLLNVVGVPNKLPIPSFVLTRTLSRGYNTTSINCPDCVVVTVTLTNIGGQPPGAGNTYPTAGFWVGTKMGTTPPQWYDTVFSVGPPTYNEGIPPGGTVQAKAIWLGSGYPSGGIALLTIWTMWDINVCGSGQIIPNACYWGDFVGGTSRVVLP